MADVVAKFLRTLIEETEKGEVEWIEAISEIHYCDVGHFRIVVNYSPRFEHYRLSHRNQEENLPKYMVSVVHHNGSEDEDLVKHHDAEIDTSVFPRYLTLVQELYVLITQGPQQGLDEDDLDVLKAATSQLKG